MAGHGPGRWRGRWRGGWRWTILAMALYPGSVLAATLSLPGPVLDPEVAAIATLRLDLPLSAPSRLTLRWTDGLGRVVETRSQGLDPGGPWEIPLLLDPGRAVTPLNRLRVSVSPVAGDDAGPRQEAETLFFVRPRGRGWRDYRIVMWQPETPAAWRTLADLGVSAGKTFFRGGAPDPARGVEGDLLAAGLGWYVENIATDFYSPYHRWTPDHPVDWKFQQVKALWLAHPDSPAALRRDPSLSDEAWITMVRQRLADAVAAHRSFRPLYYNLGDETGIADLTAYWDFDFSPPSLEAFRRDLRLRYDSLAALNAAWGTDFVRWDAVMPWTARQAIRHRGDNFAAWADFRAWMDEAFAAALAAGAEAVHTADPEAVAALEGGQTAGWGGYDYDRLSRAVDLLELSGDNRDLVRSLNPRAMVVATSFGSGPPERHRIWRELLHGSRGLILWDSGGDFADRYGFPGFRAASLDDTFMAIRTGLGALLINSEPVPAPVAIHYSPASMRAHWILEQRRTRGRWLFRDSRPDRPDDAFTVLRHRLTGVVATLGRPYRFLSGRAIEEGGLSGPDAPRLLILPSSIALSDAEIRAIRTFAREGGVVVAVGEAGMFDDHVRRRTGRPFRDVILHPLPPALFQGREADARRRASPRLDMLLSGAGLPPVLRLAGGGVPPAGVEITRLQNGAVTLVGLQAHAAPGPDNGPTGVSSGSGGVTPSDLLLPRPFHVYGLKGVSADGSLRDRISVTIGPADPILLALTETPLPALRISIVPLPSPDGAGGAGAERPIRPGGGFSVAISRPDGPALATDVFHVDVLPPKGRPVAAYGGNPRIDGGGTETAAVWPVPLAENDPPGRWTVRVRDPLTGRVVSVPVEVAPR